jgi:bifunctional non-homologous end joining protein LigD
MADEGALKSIRLFYQEGTSDKVYEARVVADDGKYTVHVAWGRRGSRLNEGTKAVKVDQAAAVRKFESLVREKKGKGYEEETADVKPADVAPPEGEGSGSKVGGKRAVVGASAQLLNAIEDGELDRFLRDEAMVAQQKLDGQRVIAHVNDTVVLTNRTGQPTAFRPAVAEALSYLPEGTIVDGEVVGDDGFWLFDVLQLAGEDVRARGYADRWSLLWHELEPALTGNARILPVAIGAAKKQSLLERLRAASAEGIVFKHRDAPYTSGRPASGGTQRKYKFVKSADVVILENAGNAYLMAVYDGRRLVQIGKVFAGTTNASRKDLDDRLGRGETPVAEVRYLYATADGQLYQPVFVGVRDDKPAGDCGHDQLQQTNRSVVDL